MAKNIAIIGDSESVKGFSAVGLDVFPCDEDEEAARLLKKLASNEGYAVIFITEDIYACAGREIERYSESLVPAIIPLPGVRGTLGTGRSRLSSFVEKAVGSDIIFND